MAEAVGVTLPVEDGLPAAEYVGLAQLAERAGYDAVLAGEVAGPEVFSLLGMIAARTDRLSSHARPRQSSPRRSTGSVSAETPPMRGAVSLNR